MEEIPDLGSTEASTQRRQEAGFPPTAGTGAGVGEQLRGGQVAGVGGDTAGDQEHLQSGTVMEDRELAALPGSPPDCTSHRRGQIVGGGVEAAPGR